MYNRDVKISRNEALSPMNKKEILHNEIENLRSQIYSKLINNEDNAFNNEIISMTNELNKLVTEYQRFMNEEISLSK